MRPSRLARRMFYPVYLADSIAEIDVKGVRRDKAITEISRLGQAQMIRCSAADDPLAAKYVFTAGVRDLFAPTWLDRVIRWLGTWI
jgi:hypothetical protein